MDFILIEGLEVSCIVGVRPFERRLPQSVRLDLSLGLDLSVAGRSGRISHTCDYDRITDEVRALLRFREYRLIEVATEELAAMLFGVHPPLVQVDIRLDKPTALHGRARGAGVKVSRRREQLLTQPEPAQFGTVEPLLEAEEAGLYLLNIAVGQRLSPAAVGPVRLLEWVVAGELHHEGRRRVAGDPIPPARQGFGAYQNLSERDATLFCCATPPWVRR